MATHSRLITVLHLCRFLVLLYSLSMLFPILVGLYFHEDDLSSFAITLATAMIIGGIGWRATAPNGRNNLITRDAFQVVVLFWMIFSLISALPFLLDRRVEMTLADGVFEGISGITTTGASVLADIDGTPKSLLYYRAQLNFIGGLGIIVLAVAILPLLGIGGTKLYQSEMPGPLKEERLTPKLQDTAKHLWFIYSGLALACGLSYHAAGMGWFDALCHSFSTVSLGGFSTRGASLGHYNSLAIEWVGGVFSVLAAVNFALYFAAIYRRRLAPILRDPECRFFALMLLLVVSYTCLELYRLGIFGAGEALVHGFFQAASVMSDNGLAAANYPNWPEHLVLLLLGASFFGGCVGSTCGGIKAIRFLLLYEQSIRELKQLIHPNGVYATKVGGKPVPERIIRSVWSLFFFYIFFACVFTWGLVAAGHDFFTAFGTVAACFNNMGIGYGDTASTFATLSEGGKWLMCLAMLFGRLEIFPILIVFSRSFWRS
ncbi:MAG: TrkH family potassium uptake protein [Porticoccaceae bacterium]